MTRSRGVLTLAACLSRGALAGALLLAGCSSHGSASNSPAASGNATADSGSTGSGAASGATNAAAGGTTAAKSGAAAGATAGAGTSGAPSAQPAGASGGSTSDSTGVGGAQTTRACPSKPGEACVTGTIAYRERMALPPAAVITMQLADVSLADAPAKVLDEYAFEAGGRQVPFAFALRYDPAAIDERHEYAVQARIELAGKLLFISDTRVSVITRGQPSTAAIMLVRVK